MNLGTARASLRYILDEPAAAYWPDAELNSYLNEANRYVWSLLSENAQDLMATLQATLTYPLVADGTIDPGLALTTTNLPPGCMKLIAVDLADTTNGYVTLRNVPYEERGNYPSYAALPNAWFFRGSKLFLAPPPNAAVTLYATYVPTVTAMAADADPLLNGILPVGNMDDCVVYRAACLALMKDEAMKMLPAIKQHYKELEEALVQQAESWKAQTSRRVIFRDEDFLV